jgi:hypothetical protein
MAFEELKRWSGRKLFGAYDQSTGSRIPNFNFQCALRDEIMRRLEILSPGAIRKEAVRKAKPMRVSEVELKSETWAERGFERTEAIVASLRRFDGHEFGLAPQIENLAERIVQATKINPEAEFNEDDVIVVSQAEYVAWQERSREFPRYFSLECLVNFGSALPAQFPLYESSLQYRFDRGVPSEFTTNLGWTILEVLREILLDVHEQMPFSLMINLVNFIDREIGALDQDEEMAARFHALSDIYLAGNYVVEWAPGGGKPDTIAVLVA